MARLPLGTYIRPTGDWYQHSRFSASAYAQLQQNLNCAVGLFNSDQLGRVCHIIGATISLGYDQPNQLQPWVAGTYYSSPGGTLGGADSGFTYETKPFFDLDPIPNVASQIFYPTGSEDVIERAVPLSLAIASTTLMPQKGVATCGAIFYPPGGIAAFKPGRGFYYWGQFTDFPDGDVVYGVTFDFVLLSD